MVNPLQAGLDKVIGQIFSGAGIVFLTILGCSVILGVIMYVKWRKSFDIIVEIKSERTDGRYQIIFDKAAIHKSHKDGTKYLRLLHQKVELPHPPYNIMQVSNKGDLIQIWKKSENEYIYMTPPIINKVIGIKQDGRLMSLSETEQKQVENEISYWNVKRKQINKGLFASDSLLMKLLPFIPQIIAGIMIVFILYILFDSLPALLSELTRLTSELKSLKNAEVVTGWTMSLFI